MTDKQKNNHINEEAEEEMGLPADVFDYLRWTAGMLNAMAWQKLGLIVDPQTGNAVKDLTQAKVAIDTVAFIFEQLKSVMADEERRAFEGAINDLRANFIQQSGS
ncbi:MAG: DUF1844 domain-containing protein [bacterium]|jgi:hypothetical protein|nr:DUF1844 domain-containing protein [bacterium]MDD4559102.1 DUF1844 domain-containing protein [bacterium]